MIEKGHKVIGLSESQGTYEGNAYHNYLLHCQLQDQKIRGIGVEVLKVKKFVYDMYPAQIGDVIHPVYDRFGKIEALQTLPAWSEKK